MSELKIPDPFVPPSDPTSLASGHYTETGILNNIFQLILTMTTVLQNAAASQANRLTFYTQWQKAYTEVMSQIPTFVSGGGHFSGTSQDQNNTRSDLNKLNATFTQTLQNRQSVISDDAKALQSSVSQTNDAVNQQSNLGTAVLQNMSTILSSIYH